MPRRRSTRVHQLRRDLASMGADLDAIYGPPGSVAPDVDRDTSTVSVHDAYGSREEPASVNVRRAAVGLQPAPESIEMQAHLLGPEHLGRFIEVRVAASRPKPGTVRPAGPLAGRLVGYRAAEQQTGPGTGEPIRAFELLIQQGPSTTTAIVSWADPIRIA